MYSQHVSRPKLHQGRSSPHSSRPSRTAFDFGHRVALPRITRLPFSHSRLPTPQACLPFYCGCSRITSTLDRRKASPAIRLAFAIRLISTLLLLPSWQVRWLYGICWDPVSGRIIVKTNHRIAFECTLKGKRQ